MSGNSSRSQNIITVSVVIISTCALFVSLYQSRVMKVQQDIMTEQLKASVWPSIEMVANTGAVKEFQISISNKGVGPAILEKTRLTHNGKVYKSWGQFLTENDTTSGALSYVSSNAKGKVMAPNETVLLIGFSSEEHIDLLNRAYRDMKFDVCYRSVYDTRWQYTKYYNESGQLIVNTNEIQTCDISVEEEFEF